MRRELSARAQRNIAAISLLVVLVVLGLMGYFVGRPMVRMVSDPERFRAWVDQYGFGGKAAFMFMVFLQTLVALVPGEPFEIAAGYAFGAVEGTMLCLIGSGIGSLAVFLLVRRYGVRLVEIFFSREKIEKLRFLRSTKRGKVLFFLIFMVPGTPKDLLSYFAGLTDLPFGLFALIATVGRLPSIVTSTVGGDALGEKQYVFAVITFVVAMLLAGVGWLVYRRICRRHEKDGKNNVPQG